MMKIANKSPGSKHSPNMASNHKQMHRWLRVPSPRLQLHQEFPLLHLPSRRECGGQQGWRPGRLGRWHRAAAGALGGGCTDHRRLLGVGQRIQALLADFWKGWLLMGEHFGQNCWGHWGNSGWYMVRVLHPPLRRHSGEIWHHVESKAVRGYGLHMGNAPRSFSVSERTYGTPKIHWLIFRWNNCNMTYNTVAPAIFRSHPPNGSARAGSCRVPAWEMPSRPCWQPPPPPGWNGPWAKPWPLDVLPTL